MNNCAEWSIWHTTEEDKSSGGDDSEKPRGRIDGPTSAIGWRTGCKHTTLTSSYVLTSVFWAVNEFSTLSERLPASHVYFQALSCVSVPASVCRQYTFHSESRTKALLSNFYRKINKQKKANSPVNLVNYEFKERTWRHAPEESSHAWEPRSRAGGGVSLTGFRGSFPT